MKFLLMMSSPGKRAYQYESWAPKDWERHMAFLQNFNAKLTAAGELVDIVALTAPDKAVVVRAGKNGKPVTDGVFPESKEFLAGFWIIDVASAERAYQLAAEASAAPGPGGAPLNMDIEVREVPSGPPPA